MPAKRISIRQLTLISLGLFLLIFLLDFIFGDGGLDVFGDVIPESASRFWSAVWFSEAVGFIVLPVVLVAYLKRKSLSLLPILSASLVTILFAATLVAGQFAQYPEDWRYSNPVTETYRVLHSTIPYQFAPGGEDPMLASPLTPFLIGQIPFIAGLAVGSGLLYGIRKYQNR